MNRLEIKIKIVILLLDISKLYVFLDKNDLPYQIVSSAESLDYLANEIFKSHFNLSKTLYYLEQLYSFKDRENIDIVYYILLPKFILKTNDSKDWMEVTRSGILNRKDQKILDYALQRLKWKIEYTNAIYSLLPSEFTLTELQIAYETVLGKRLDKRNFRKKIRGLKLLKSTGIKKQSVKARPALLYRFKDRGLKYVKIL